MQKILWTNGYIFLKKSEVKDTFKAKGLKEAGQVLDIMKLPKDDEYNYNRYLDSLYLKESELFSLQTEAAFKIKEARSIEIAKNGILNGLDNELISTLTNISIIKIIALRKAMNK